MNFLAKAEHAVPNSRIESDEFRAALRTSHCAPHSERYAS